MVKRKRKSSLTMDEPPRRNVLLWIFAFFFAAIWIFILGVLVGRGTAPVKFDIGRLERQLEAVRQIELLSSRNREGTREKVPQPHALGFYDDLKEDVESPPVKITEKKSLKELSRKKGGVKAARPPGESVKKPKTAPAAKKEKNLPAPENSTSGDTYTIQVAAFNRAEDAAEMKSTLNKKGFSAYTITKKIGATTWYRIRVGNFRDRDQALAEEKRLKAGRYKTILLKN